jgi:hypothetical protein
MTSLTSIFERLRNSKCNLPPPADPFDIADLSDRLERAGHTRLPPDYEEFLAFADGMRVGEFRLFGTHDWNQFHLLNIYDATVPPDEKLPPHLSRFAVIGQTQVVDLPLEIIFEPKSERYITFVPYYVPDFACRTIYGYNSLVDLINGELKSKQARIHLGHH